MPATTNNATAPAATRLGVFFRKDHRRPWALVGGPFANRSEADRSLIDLAAAGPSGDWLVRLID